MSERSRFGGVQTVALILVVSYSPWVAVAERQRRRLYSAAAQCSMRREGGTGRIGEYVSHVTHFNV